MEAKGQLSNRFAVVASDLPNWTLLLLRCIKQVWTPTIVRCVSFASMLHIWHWTYFSLQLFYIGVLKVVHFSTQTSSALVANWILSTSCARGSHVPAVKAKQVNPLSFCDWSSASCPYHQMLLQIWTIQVEKNRPAFSKQKLNCMEIQNGDFPAGI